MRAKFCVQSIGPGQEGEPGDGYVPGGWECELYT